MLHGRAVIDLHNTRTHRDERIVHDNALTNWIRDVCKPRSLHLLGRPNAENLNRDNIFRGLMMFPNALSNDPDDYLFPAPNVNPMTAHASGATYSGVDTTRGSFNDAQSSSVDGAITSVWDFTQEQGNGTIASLGLCPTEFAVAGNGSKSGVTAILRNVKQQPFGSARSSIGGWNSGGIRYYDGENGTTIVARFQSGVMSLVEVPCTWTQIDPLLGGHGGATFYTPSTVETETYDLTAYFTTTNMYTFVSDDGKMYIFGGSWNNGSTKTLVIFDLKTRTYTTQSVVNNTGVTLAGATDATGFNMLRMAVDNGILYVPASNNRLAYINLSNNTDCGLVKTPDGLSDLTVSVRSIAKIGNMVIASPSDDYFTQASNTRTAYVVYKGESWHWGWGTLNVSNYVSTNGVIIAGQSISKVLFAVGGVSNNNMTSYNDIWTEVPCLTTKNNLDSAVTKTADMTMRVTYTVTDQAE